MTKTELIKRIIGILLIVLLLLSFSNNWVVARSTNSSYTWIQTRTDLRESINDLISEVAWIASWLDIDISRIKTVLLTVTDGGLTPNEIRTICHEGFLFLREITENENDETTRSLMTGCIAMLVLYYGLFIFAIGTIISYFTDKAKRFRPLCTAATLIYAIILLIFTYKLNSEFTSYDIKFRITGWAIFAIFVSIPKLNEFLFDRVSSLIPKEKQETVMQTTSQTVKSLGDSLKSGGSAASAKVSDLVDNISTKGFRTVLSGAWTCPECGRSNTGKDLFCPGCGTAKPKQQVCPVCGAPIGINNKFCGRCGAKIELMEMQENADESVQSEKF